jgi:Mrp family chromosome partitioning ATPase
MPRLNSISKIKLVAIIFGAFAAIGIGMAVVLELFLDQSLRRSADIEQGLRLPMMLAIPSLRPLGLARGGKRRRSPLLTGGTSIPHGAETQDFAIARSLQVYIDALRDRVTMSMSGIQRPRFLGITSCGPSAGVTTIAAGLAVSLSRSNNGRILLIDANFINSTNHPFYQLNPSNSLMEILAGEEVKPVKIQHHLYMLSPGEVNGELSRISLAERFTVMMEFLRNADFDYVIVDLPPVDLTSSSFRLAGLMDQNLLVVESETTTKDEARRTLNILNQTQAQVSGVVLNRTRKYLPKWIHQEL